MVHIIHYAIEISMQLMFVCLMVFNVTFNNISVISWRSVLLVEETGGPGETQRLSQVTDKLYHILLFFIVIRLH